MIHEFRNSFRHLLDATPYSVNSVSSIALPPTITVTNASYQLSRDSSSDEGECDPISPQFSIDSFIGKLMRLLLDERFSMILSFLPDKQSFGIINVKAFMEDVMPNEFGIKSFASFGRKLKRWGFERIMDRSCHDRYVFWHPHFRKGDWMACSKIKCEPRLLPHKSKGTCRDREVIPLPSGSYQQQHREDAAFVSMHGMSSYPKYETWKPTLQDVTSMIVGAALETLRMEEAVIAPVISVATILQRHQERAVMLAMHHQDMMAQLSSTLKSES